jgi:hypothetical protein
MLRTGFNDTRASYEGTPSSKAALGMDNAKSAHGRNMPKGFSAMRYFIRTNLSYEDAMSRTEAVVLASRTLGLLLIVWALSEVAALPAYLQSYVYYSRHPTSGANLEYLQYTSHHYFIDIGFCITKIVGYSLLARWLFKGGVEVEFMLLPEASEEIVISNEPQ